MIEIKRIRKGDVQELLSNDGFWNHSFLSTTRHRLDAQYKNPNLEDNDIVMLLSYLDNELVGYMGVFVDKINVDNSIKKIGWLSTWWVHPKTKGSGIGREILETMYSEFNGQIGISQFTSSAKRVYDKSGYFTDLKKSKGIKAVLRSNLTTFMPSVFPKTKNISFIFTPIDHFLNFFIKIKLASQKKSLLKRLTNISIEYLSIIDDETLELIKQFNKGDISNKGKAFFEWLKAYTWIQKAPILQLTNKVKYEFSSYDYDFEFSLVKIKEGDSCIGFIVLQKRNDSMKVLFTYFDESKTNIVSTIIILQAIAQKTVDITCYDDAICDSFRKSSQFLYRTKKLKYSIISKAFNVTDFSNKRVNFGDGDCCFT